MLITLERGAPLKAKIPFSFCFIPILKGILSAILGAQAVKSSSSRASKPKTSSSKGMSAASKSKSKTKTAPKSTALKKAKTKIKTAQFSRLERIIVLFSRGT